jgi:U3 small nucleolar RNA-associated protein MPP10
MADVTETVPLLPELLALSNLLEEKPEYFVSGNQDLQAAALEVTKFTFDLCKFHLRSFENIHAHSDLSRVALKSEALSRPHIIDLLSSLDPSEAPKTRSQVRANAERNPSSSPPPKLKFEATPLTSLFLDGMDEDQVWAQLDLRAKTVCEMLEHALEGEVDENGERDGEGGKDSEERLRNASLALKNDGEVDLEGLDSMEMDFDEDSDSNMESEEEEDSEIEPEDDADFGEGVTELRDSSTDEENDKEDIGAPSSLVDVVRNNRTPSVRRSKAGAHAGLDDGFFDLNLFNAETEEAEAMTVSKGGLRKGEEGDDSDDDMSVDLFAPVDGIENFDEEDLEHDPGGMPLVLVQALQLLMDSSTYRGILSRFL